jgi:hypothetical protein
LDRQCFASTSYFRLQSFVFGLQPFLGSLNRSGQGRTRLVTMALVEELLLFPLPLRQTGLGTLGSFLESMLLFQELTLLPDAVHQLGMEGIETLRLEEVRVAQGLQDSFLGSGTRDPARPGRFRIGEEGQATVKACVHLGTVAAQVAHFQPNLVAESGQAILLPPEDAAGNPRR